MRLPFLCAAILALSVQAQAQKTIRASEWIEKSLESQIRSQGGKSEDLWRKPWRFALLFNSSQVNNKSAYLESAIIETRTFLTNRLKDGRAHEVWFYPYQLDIYSKAGQCVSGVQLSKESIVQIERAFPKTPFQIRGDGKTDYPKRGGHSNIAAREALQEILGPSQVPTLIIQFTDIGISESPGTEEDAETRRQDQRTAGVDKLGLIAYDPVATPFKTGLPNQTFQVFLYGPESLNGGGPQLPMWEILFGIMGFAALAGIGIAVAKSGLTGSGKNWIVSVARSSEATVRKGQVIAFVGPGGKAEEADEKRMLDGENFPAARLFSLKATSKGLEILDGVWSCDGDRLVTESGKLPMKDENGKSRTLEIKLELAP